ncbi:MAG: ATP-binding cassette domain-containing protein [Solobacterium sp.]|nr:ATP-binding cassette domain-containing protein [Solobacterium sp.]
MGWFEEQIKQRKDSDNKAFQETFADIAGAVTGDRFYHENNEVELGKTAIEQVLRWYNFVPKKEVPASLTRFSDQMEYMMRPFGVMYREVDLTPGWWKNAMGPMIGFLDEKDIPVALIPQKTSGYYYLDPDSGKKVQLNNDSETKLIRRGYCFYKPFPLRALGIKDLFVYAFQTVSLFERAKLLIFTGIGIFLGMYSNKASYLLMGPVLHSKSLRVLAGIAAFTIGLTICQLVNSTITSIINASINTRMGIQVKAASMMRILSLPPSFFKNYSSGDLSYRMQYINQVCSLLFTMIFSVGLNSIFSLAYVGQIFSYAPTLVVPALTIMVISVGFNLVTTFMQLSISKDRMALSTKESGMSYSMISGIQKIRLSGSEKRIFSRWGKLYAKQLEYQYNPPFFLKVNGTISMMISLTGTLIIYSAAIAGGISYEQYYAFMNAYGMIYGAFSAITGIATQIAGVKPIIDLINPILKQEPEVSEGKEVLTKLNGAIEVSNISFRYDPQMPYVLDNLSLKINPGQYIAIVGKSGCGKSTLIRILLGFEIPEKGNIFYDGKELSRIDAKSLRQKIGTVTQNGKLFSGSIYENIVISAPWLTMEDAWAAAEVAGLADDIRNMPMGMHTMISEGAGGFSGGQKQRMMIARAVAPKPKILIFDEATSALDNLTQKKVSEALDSLKCTRIVIAHRLSTIQNCDRIMVLDHGNIIEDGTYDELMKKNGFFADLVRRQIVEEEDDDNGGNENGNTDN